MSSLSEIRSNQQQAPQVGALPEFPSFKEPKISKDVDMHEDDAAVTISMAFASLGTASNIDISIMRDTQKIEFWRKHVKSYQATRKNPSVFAASSDFVSDPSKSVTSQEYGDHGVKLSFENNEICCEMIEGPVISIIPLEYYENLVNKFFKVTARREPKGALYMAVRTNVNKKFS